MRSGAHTLAGLVVLIVLSSCSDERLGGNTTQTENTAAARTIRVDSLLPDWNRPSQVATVATLRLDSTNFDFKETDSTGQDLTVEAESGRLLPFELVYWDKPAKKGRLRVRLDSSLLKRGDLFVLKWKQPLRTRSDTYGVWMSIPDSQKLALRSVPVADFENWSSTTLLPTRPVWEVLSLDSFIITSVGFVPAGSGRSGSALSVEYKTASTGIVVIKTPLVATQQAKSVRALDSIVFWAKSATRNSTMFIALEHRELFKAWQQDTLDTVWTRFRVRPSDFVPASNPNGGNRGWVAVRDSVTHLTFLMFNGSKVWIDDIRLYGLDREDVE